MSTTSVDEAFDADGVRIQTRDYGGDGMPALLFHAADCAVACWDGLAPLLRPELHAVAFDIRGHGRAGAVPFTLDGAVQDARHVADRYGFAKPLLVGHSMGCSVALQYAVEAPCAGLIVLDGLGNLQRDLHGEVNAELPPAVDHRQRSLVHELDRQDVRSLLGRLNCRAMFVFASGQTDDDRQRSTPKRRRVAEYVATNHPNVRIEWIATGHMIPFTAPSEAAVLIKSFGADGR